MSSNDILRRQRKKFFVEVLVITIVINLILLLVPVLPITEVPNCFTKVCDPNITFESIWERYN